MSLSLPLSTIESMAETQPKRRFSASMINQWQACSLSAKFSRIDMLPRKTGARTVFGSCIHSALQHWHDCRDQVQTLRLWDIMWKDPASIGCTIDYWGPFDHWDELNEKGITIIKEYIDRRSWEKIEHIGSEVGFLVPMGNYELTGFIDELEVHRDSKRKEFLGVIDLKSGKAKTKTDLRFDHQFTSYGYAVSQKEFWVGNGEFPGFPMGEVMWERFRDMPKRLVWMDLQGGREIDAGERNQDDFERMYRAMQMIDRAIDLEVYVPNISGSSCTYCDHAGPDGPCPVQFKHEEPPATF